MWKTPKDSYMTKLSSMWKSFARVGVSSLSKTWRRFRSDKAFEDIVSRVKPGILMIESDFSDRSSAGGAFMVAKNLAVECLHEVCQYRYCGKGEFEGYTNFVVPVKYIKEIVKAYTDKQLVIFYAKLDDKAAPLVRAIAHIPLTVLAVPAPVLSIGRSHVNSKLKKYPKFQAVAIAIQRSGFEIVFVIWLVPFTPVHLGECMLASWVGMMVDVVILDSGATYQAVLLDADFCSNIAFLKIRSHQQQKVAEFAKKFDVPYRGRSLVAVGCNVPHCDLRHAKAAYFFGGYGSAATKIEKVVSHTSTTRHVMSVDIDGTGTIY